MPSTISLRIHYPTWSDETRLREQLALLETWRGVVGEVALFTGHTHPALPLAEVRRRAGLLGRILPAFKALGLRTGINHLATIGHLDENPSNSLRDPWQHLVDMSGAVSETCYCAADPEVQAYILNCYTAFAQAAPEFIWIDDDVRLESHPKSVAFACFCPHCLAEFGTETGRPWTREELLTAFKEGPPAGRLALRRRWMEHNRRYIARILQLARQAVDKVDPGIRLGLMTGEISYSGYGYKDWTAAMSPTQPSGVKFRPGGGFYNDDNPLNLLVKAHSVGRQNAFVPPAVTDIQYEHENFPYLPLSKSRTIFTTEIAGSMAAGCTGVALNTLTIAGDPLEEYHPYFNSVKAAQPFFNALVETCGRSPCEGVWTAFGPDHVAALAPDGTWPGPGSWGGDLHATSELFTLGIPAAYTRDDARATLLLGDGVMEWSDDRLLDLLAGGIMLDGPALQHLAARGLADLAGFEIAGTRTTDTLECLTDDPINGRFAGWHRDCRPSFWSNTTYLLRPANPAARSLASCQDFTPATHGCCAGIFENRLGGRVAVMGYNPWNMLGSLAKTAQLRTLVRWLSRDRLPAYVESFHRIALWCRRDASGNPAYVLINAGIDPAENVTLLAQTPDRAYRTVDMRGVCVDCPSTPHQDPYRMLHPPTIPPWQALLLQVRP